MQNTDIFINPRQSVTFSNSIFHLEEKVTNYLFILHSQINKIASRADDVIKCMYYFCRLKSHSS